MPATAPKPVLLELLRCPEPHHAPLAFDREEGVLVCSECARVFRVEDGIPVMLLDGAAFDSAELGPQTDRRPAAADPPATVANRQGTQ